MGGEFFRGSKRICYCPKVASLPSKTKAQIAVEYLMIMGFVTISITALSAIYYLYSQSSQDELSGLQLSRIAKKIVDSSEEVHYLGAPSQIALQIYLPHDLVFVNLSDKEFSLKYRSSNGVVEVAEASAVNLSGSFPIREGLYTITVKAQDNYVNVSYR